MKTKEEYLATLNRLDVDRQVRQIIRDLYVYSSTYDFPNEELNVILNNIYSRIPDNPNKKFVIVTWNIASMICKSIPLLNELVDMFPLVGEYNDIDVYVDMYITNNATNRGFGLVGYYNNSNNIKKELIKYIFPQPKTSSLKGLYKFRIEK